MNKKKVLTRIIYIFTMILLLIFIILLFLYVFEKIYSLSDEVKWNREDSVIQQMNSEKLSNSNANSEQMIWLYNDEKLPPKSDKKRILVVGDSYVWGQGYSNANYIWWQQLRNKLMENGYNDVEIVAMGMYNYNTYQEMLMLKKADIVNNINPDLIIFSYVINDTEAWQYPYDDDPIWKNIKINYDEPLNTIFSKDISATLKNLYPNLYDKTNNLLTEKYSSIDNGFGLSVKNYEKEVTSDRFLVNYGQNVLVPLKDYLDNEVGVPYFFVDIPFWPSDSIMTYFSNINKIFDSYNIKFFDLSKLYKDESPYYDSNIYKINPANGHPGTKTTEFVARKVLSILESDYSEIIGNKTQVNMNDIIINDPMPRSINLHQLSDDEYSFYYPGKREKTLYMPIEKKYIKLNFMYPVDLKSIEINGQNINDIEVYINKIDINVGYDNQKMYKVEYAEKYIWNINCQKVTSINISANIKNGDSSKLTIKLVKG